MLYNKAGIAEIQLNDLEAAKKDLERSLKYNPQYADARNNLGVVARLERIEVLRLHLPRPLLRARCGSAQDDRGDN